MGWTAPPTWATARLMDAPDMNLYLRDNLNFLKARPLVSAVITGTTTSTSFAAATASASLTTYGGAVLMVFNGYHSHTAASNSCAMDFAIDGVLQGDATNGMEAFHTHTTIGGNKILTASFVTSTPPSAGAHTYEVYRKTASGTLTLTGRLYVSEWF